MNTKSHSKPFRCLLAGEPNEILVPNDDTGALLAYELLSRGHEVDFCELRKMDFRRSPPDYLAHLSVRKIQKVSIDQKLPFTLGPVREEPVNRYAAILQRKDPPVDETYLGHANQFTHAPSSIVQINNPAYTREYSEHLLPMRFPQYATPTCYLTSYQDFVKAIRTAPGETVAKPVHWFGGVGITFFSPTSPEVDIERFWEKWKPHAVIQPFLKEIETIGDLRILVMNQKIIGHYLRKPKPGSRIANTHAGASAHHFEPTPRQVEASLAVAKELAPKGLYLLGLDFIGDHLNEVNITCPSGTHQINGVMGIHVEKRLIDELEKLVASPPVLEP